MTILDYAEQFLESFESSPFNEVDSLILSQFTYLYFDDIVPNLEAEGDSISIAELLKAEKIPKMLDKVRDPQSNQRLLFALGISPRFRDIRMCYYDNQLDLVGEKQFAAVTYLLDEKLAYLAFRGTDFSFVGWKEDFNMVFISPVPAQLEAVAYLNIVADKIPQKIMLGGHSKGGNLAVYAAMECEESVQARLTRVFSHDGPGFREEVFKTNKFKQIEAFLEKTVPQSSVIGMLLFYHEDYIVVESKQFGIMQHDPFSWLVEENEFKKGQGLSGRAEHLNISINQWLRTLDDTQRELFITTLYNVLKSTGVNDFNDFSEEWHKNSLQALGAIKEIDSETKRFLMETLKSLFALYLKNFGLRLK